MERFKKEKLSLLHGDSTTVKRLKYECNELIEQYNKLEKPLSEQGQKMANQINIYIMKINQLKDSSYDNRR